MFFYIISVFFKIIIQSPVCYSSSYIAGHTLSLVFDHQCIYIVYHDRLLIIFLLCYFQKPAPVFYTYLQIEGLENKIELLIIIT